MTDASTGLNPGAATTTPGVSARVRGMVFPPFDVLNQKAAALRRAGRREVAMSRLPVADRAAILWRLWQPDLARPFRAVARRARRLVGGGST